MPKNETTLPDAETAPDVFDEALEAIDAVKAASKKADEIIERAREKWLKIEASSRNRPSDLPPLWPPNKEAIVRVVGLARRYGPSVAKWMTVVGGSGAAVGLAADNGGFGELFENFSLIGQIFGGEP